MDELANDGQESSELRDYFRVIRQRSWIIVLSVIIVVGAAVNVSLLATPKYRASAMLVYQKTNLDQALFGSQIFPDTNVTRDLLTAAALVKLDQVAGEVKRELGSPLSTRLLLEMVAVKPAANTNVVDIEAVSTDPAEASDVANGFARQFIAFRQSTDRATVAAARQLVKDQLDTLGATEAESAYGLMLRDKYESLRILESMQDGGFTLVQPAVPPAGPFSPRTTRDAILAFAIGLVLGLGLAFLSEYLDRRVKDEKGLERYFGVPVLASTPSVGGKWRGGSNGKRSSRPIGFASHPSMLEAFRTLRSSLQYFDTERNVRTILVTSGLPKEGKTVTVVNLAFSLALAGNRVVILEADLRKPMVPEYLGLENKIGLSTLLAGKATIAEALQVVQLEQFLSVQGNRIQDQSQADAASLRKNLLCLASGPIPPNPAELLGSARMKQVIDELRNLADYVLIDTPPVLLVADALTLSSNADAVLLVARVNSTTRDEAREVSNRLKRSTARTIGVVAGGVKPGSGYSHRRGYSYGSPY